MVLSWWALSPFLGHGGAPHRLLHRDPTLGAMLASPPSSCVMGINAARTTPPRHPCWAWSMDGKLQRGCGP